MSIDYDRISSIPQIRKVGRPKKWETVEELEEAIQSYFDSCFVPKMRQVKVKNGEEVDYVDEPVLDKDDNQVYIQIRPFTVTGLAVHLDTTRETLLDYETKPENAEFSDAIKKAKQIVQMYNEEGLHRSTQVTGIIFNLKNNFSWVDRRETDITSKDKQIMPGVIEAKAADILEDDDESE